MLPAILIVLAVLVSIATILISIIVVMAIVRVPGILRELERGNRQANAVVVNQLNDIIRRLAEIEKTMKERA